MKKKFASGYYWSIVLDNGIDGKGREEMKISLLVDDNGYYFVWITLNMPVKTCEFIDCDGKNTINVKDRFVCAKIVRMAIRGLVMEKLGIKEPMSYLRLNERAWMDRVDEDMFSMDKWTRF